MVELRVVSWNVRSLRDDTRAVVQVVRDLRPDVLCLQEAPRFWRWRHAVADLARRTDLLHVAGGRTTGGPALLASLRVDVREVHEWRLSKTRGQFQRGVAGATVRVGGAPLVVASTHLGLTAEERVRHAAELLDRLARLDGRAPVVLAGDVNETPGAPAWTALTGRLVDAHARSPQGGATTFPSRGPRKRIDAVFVDPGVAVVGAGVPAHLGSSLLARATDHLPVVADLRVEPPGATP